jgi:hypothetical protein
MKRSGSLMRLGSLVDDQCFALPDRTMNVCLAQVWRAIGGISVLSRVLVVFEFSMEGINHI